MRNGYEKIDVTDHPKYRIADPCGLRRRRRCSRTAYCHCSSEPNCCAAYSGLDPNFSVNRNTKAGFNTCADPCADTDGHAQVNANGSTSPNGDTGTDSHCSPNTYCHSHADGYTRTNRHAGTDTDADAHTRLRLCCRVGVHQANL